MQEKLRSLSEDENNQKWLFVTEEDIKNLPCFQNETLIAIKAPHGTTLEVPYPDEAVDYPQRRYRIVLRSTMGPIDVYLVSQFEEKFEEINASEVEASVPSTSGADENASAIPATEEGRGNEVDFQGIEAQRLCSDINSSQDFVSGIMKIVPDVDHQRVLKTLGLIAIETRTPKECLNKIMFLGLPSKRSSETPKECLNKIMFLILGYLPSVLQKVQHVPENGGGRASVV
ncbi:Transcription factor E2FB [Forsythia ovata]|uniref:Transcription factor E2FB n=1 Tax=Forsythia ovata TaxID=205694 RepID=A0ABD1VI73_9LAMI